MGFPSWLENGLRKQEKDTGLGFVFPSEVGLGRSSHPWVETCWLETLAVPKLGVPEFISLLRCGEEGELKSIRHQKRSLTLSQRPNVGKSE